MFKNICFFLIILGLFISCGVNNIHFSEKIMGIKLSSQIPFISSKDGSLTLNKDSCLIYYKENMILFRVPYEDISFNKGTLINDTMVFSNDNIDFKLTRYLNFVYTRDMKYGFRYDSINAQGSGKFDVDSLLKREAFKGAVFVGLEDSLVKSSHEKGKLIFFETYVSKRKIDESFPDSTYLTYKPQIKGIEYSLSKKADSIKKMKLFKVEFIYNSIPAGKTYNFEIPRKHFIFQIEKLDILNQKEVNEFFERFKKDSSIKNPN